MQDESALLPTHHYQLLTFHFPPHPLALTRIGPHSAGMNQSQQQTIDRVFELLSEHFEHVVIAVGTYDEEKQYTTAASFTGGVAAAIGLCKLYEAKWTKEHLWGPDEEE